MGCRLKRMAGLNVAESKMQSRSDSTGHDGRRRRQAVASAKTTHYIRELSSDAEAGDSSQFGVSHETWFGIICDHMRS